MSTLLSGREVTVTPTSKGVWQVEFRGIDMGGKVTLHSVGYHYIVLKVAGHSAWAGLGRQPEYVPASFLVFNVDQANPPQYSKMSSTTIKLGEFVAEFPARGMKA